MNSKISFLFYFILINSSFSQINKPVFSFSFDNSFKDSSVNKTKVITHGNPVFVIDRYGVNCNALYFDGNSFLEIPNSKKIEKIEKFTLSFWCKIEFNQNDLNWLTIICKGDKSKETLDNPSYRLQIMQSNTQSTLSIHSAFTEYIENFKENPLIGGKWIHFTITFDGLYVNYYINGNLYWSKKNPKNIIKNKSSLYIGKDIPGATEYLKGSLDDLVFYNYSFNSNEVLNYYLSQNNKIKKINNEDKCLKDYIVNTNENSCSAKFDYQLINIKDNCNPIESKLIYGPKTGSNLPLGKTEIKYNIKYSNFTQECKFEVNVIDNVKPKLLTSTDTIIVLDKDDFEYNILQPKFKDNCEISKVIQINYLDNKITTIGTHKVQYEVYDINNNKINYTQTIVIKNKTIINNNNEKTDKIDLIKRIKTNEKQLKLVVFDNQLEDNDTISIFYNGIEIIKQQPIKLKDKKSIVMDIILEENKKNSIVIKAWNTGDIGLNTCRFTLYKKEDYETNINPKNIFEKTLTTKPGLSAEIIVNYEK